MVKNKTNLAHIRVNEDYIFSLNSHQLFKLRS